MLLARPSRRVALGGLALIALSLAAAVRPGAPLAASAPNPSTRFSDLAEITPATVSRLKPLWTFHLGEFPGGSPAPRGAVPGVQTRPVLAGPFLIVTTTTSKVIAIDAETGAERWRFDPFAGLTRACEQPNRGASLWEERDGKGQAVTRTIFSGTCDGRLVALDASDGTPRAAFADHGILDLKPGADVRAGEEFAITSPPAVFENLVIVGTLVPEDRPRGPSGDVRAFDVRTGREVWRFHTVPRPGEFGHETWADGAWERRTGVNVWSSMSVDATRGLVFLPVGSASYDFYGGDRKGRPLFANSLVALDARTGARRWHFQLVHHDLWDYDPPAQPILADITRNGSTVPAVIQLTKMGLVFVFNRETGEPVFGVEERPVPASSIDGESAAPTQPFPLKPLPLARIAAVTRADLTNVTEDSHRECAALFDRLTSGGIYTPPGPTLTLSFPGTLGGATWSGGSVNPALQYLFVNTNDVGAVGRMAPAPPGLPLTFRRESDNGAYARFWDSQQLPCQAPPWGRLHAIDLATGDIAWQVPLGDAPQLAARGITGTGTPNLGGSVATAGGLVFIGGANDRQLRAFDARTGRVVWHAELPASGHATPLVYRAPASGHEIVVIAAGGGGRFSSAVSDTIVAFALGQ
jgi:quinoprotein glucose dehydrogenase